MTITTSVLLNSDTHTSPSPKVMEQKRVVKASPIHRRRRVFLFVTFFVILVLLFHGSFELPEVLKDANISNLSRANIVDLVKYRTKVSEIYGLIHLVTGETEFYLNHIEGLDISQPVPLSVYAKTTGWLDWKEEQNRINMEYPVVVFSKSYCPYSRRAKLLLQSYDISPPLTIIEVDLREDAAQIKQLLSRLTEHATFPNIIVQGRSLGGSDDLQALHTSHVLKHILQSAGVTVNGDIDTV